MRIAVISDIHGDMVALDAVLADIRDLGGIDRVLILGDLAALGADPVGTLERLTQLNNSTFVRGNTDRYVVTGERPHPTPTDALSDPSLLSIVLEVQASFSWTQGAIASAGWLDWLSDLPLEARLTLPDGARLLAVHASPGRDDGPGVTPDTDEVMLTSLVAGCDADLVLVGHTHRQVSRRVGSVQIVNPGSVAIPIGGEVDASYALIEATADGHRLELRRVPYDAEAAIAALARVRHPSLEYLSRRYRGQHTPAALPA